MSEPGPFGSGGSLEDLLRNLARLLTSQGPVNWEIARQLAQWTATEGEAEDNPDPLSRVRLEELLRVADLHVSDTTGLPTSATGGLLTARTVTRSEWSLRTLDAWRPFLERLATSLAAGSEPDERPEGLAGDPMAQLLGNLPQAVAPLLFGMQAGSMVGHLGQPGHGSVRPAGAPPVVGRTALRARDHRPVRRRTGVFPRTTSGFGSACTRSLTMPSSAAPTCGPGWRS